MSHKCHTRTRQVRDVCTCCMLVIMEGPGICQEWARFVVILTYAANLSEKIVKCTETCLKWFAICIYLLIIFCIFSILVNVYVPTCIKLYVYTHPVMMWLGSHVRSPWVVPLSLPMARICVTAYTYNWTKKWNGLVFDILFVDPIWFRKKCHLPAWRSRLIRKIMKNRFLTWANRLPIISKTV